MKGMASFFPVTLLLSKLLLRQSQARQSFRVFKDPCKALRRSLQVHMETRLPLAQRLAVNREMAHRPVSSSLFLTELRLRPLFFLASAVGDRPSCRAAISSQPRVSTQLMLSI